MNECVYLARPKQIIGTTSPINRFSFLIDSDQGNYNFSFLIGMFNAEISDRLVVNVVFSEEEGTFDLSKSHKRKSKVTSDSPSEPSSIFLGIIKDPMTIRYHAFSGRIPVSTRFISVSFECGHRRSSSFFCIFDDVYLSLFQATV